ncbi:MAG: sucrose phosphorylase [Chloroflexi bacterium HGW-Chloroflexi-4]|jgi:sucrose phosphorylase|nr:MAG: sucrose phosphorylase [Chloroflexi bacterium HGW-Chloroflexi-4]
MVNNLVQLITYPDSLGGDLNNLNQILEKYFPGIFIGGIHILPPFPSSGDRGFAPLTYLEIDPKFGTWEDIKKIGEKHAVLLDLMVNHISAQSPFFKDFITNGFDSKYADLFITIEKKWPNGKPLQTDIEKMFLRREKPYSEFKLEKTDQYQKVWSTFGRTNPSEQIDLDINAPITIDLLKQFLTNFSKNNIKIVRLDAVGYVIKKLGTSCFFVEPEIYHFLEWFCQLAESLKIEVLPEIHAEPQIQFKLANRGYWIYDFILPYTILEAIVVKSSKKLKDYLKIRPHHQFTMLDCHDGVPIKPDLDGLYQSKNSRKVVNHCKENGANFSLIISEAHKDPDGFDVHQIRGTYYSLLGCDDTAYLIARAIQFFTPGIPQVYYVGLLAGRNDEEAVKITGEGREINRHNYTMKEIAHEVERDVVKKLLDLIKFRNTQPVFNGVFEVEDSDDDSLILSWNYHNQISKLRVDLKTIAGEIVTIDSNNNEKKVFQF